jgi:NAD-dependent SIR2 family protein deacetylase
MFGDMEYVGHPEQEKSFQNFLRKEVDLALLVGSSGAVPTNDYLALELKNRGTKLININPDQSANNIAQAEIFIPLKSGDTFCQLDELIS